MGVRSYFATSAPAGCGVASGSGVARVWPPGGSAVFSPYVDVTLTAPFDLTVWPRTPALAR